MSGATDGIVVIGAGAAGLIAADTITAAGHAVTIVDHMRSPGRKLILAGRSGLNITNAAPLDQLLDHYGAARQWLEPSIRSFPPEALRQWCAELGEPTFVGSSGRVFPASMRATPLVRSVVRRLTDRSTTWRLQHEWKGWNDHGDVVLVDRRTNAPTTITARATLLALGGASWPTTGSDARWAPMLAQLGVEIAAFTPSNCGVEVPWSDPFVQRFAGAPVKNIRASVGTSSTRAEAVVTARGLEGGAVYNLGPAIRAALARHGEAQIAFDVQPDRDHATVVRALGNRRRGESTANWLRRTLRLTPVAAGLVREACNNDIPTTPDALAHLVRNVHITVTGLEGLARAISSSGGITRHSCNDDFSLRQLPAVYAVGEMLDWDAPTGGYLLQATMSTAVAAARAIVS